jgi:hypothetical protein
MVSLSSMKASSRNRDEVIVTANRGLQSPRASSRTKEIARIALPAAILSSLLLLGSRWRHFPCCAGRLGRCCHHRRQRRQRRHPRGPEAHVVAGALFKPHQYNEISTEFPR